MGPGDLTAGHPDIKITHCSVTLCAPICELSMLPPVESLLICKVKVNLRLKIYAQTENWSESLFCLN